MLLALDFDVLQCPKCPERLEALELDTFKEDGETFQRIWWTCRGLKNKTCQFPLWIPRDVFWTKRTEEQMRHGFLPLPNIHLLPPEFHYLYPKLFRTTPSLTYRKTRKLKGLMNTLAQGQSTGNSVSGSIRSCSSEILSIEGSSSALSEFDEKEIPMTEIRIDSDGEADESSDSDEMANEKLSSDSSQEVVEGFDGLKHSPETKQPKDAEGIKPKETSDVKKKSSIEQSEANDSSISVEPVESGNAKLVQDHEKGDVTMAADEEDQAVRDDAESISAWDLDDDASNKNEAKKKTGLTLEDSEGSIVSYRPPLKKRKNLGLLSVESQSLKTVSGGGDDINEGRPLDRETLAKYMTMKSSTGMAHLSWGRTGEEPPLVPYTELFNLRKEAPRRMQASSRVRGVPAEQLLETDQCLDSINLVRRMKQEDLEQEAVQPHRPKAAVTVGSPSEFKREMLPFPIFDERNWRRPVQLGGRTSLDAFVTAYNLRYNRNEYLDCICTEMYKRDIMKFMPSIPIREQRLVKQMHAMRSRKRSNTIEEVKKDIDPTTLRLQIAHRLGIPNLENYVKPTKSQNLKFDDAKPFGMVPLSSVPISGSPQPSTSHVDNLEANRMKGKEILTTQREEDDTVLNLECPEEPLDDLHIEKLVQSKLRKYQEEGIQEKRKIILEATVAAAEAARKREATRAFQVSRSISSHSEHGELLDDMYHDVYDDEEAVMAELYGNALHPVH